MVGLASFLMVLLLSPPQISWPALVTGELAVVMPVFGSRSSADSARSGHMTSQLTTDMARCRRWAERPVVSTRDLI
ncbi:MAG: hypothetical protein CMP06_14110 [Xanthomonadales bacterium]|nr:hypothetical protein [Xanthomonadales bacterium]